MKSDRNSEHLEELESFVTSILFVCTICLPSTVMCLAFWSQGNLPLLNEGPAVLLLCPRESTTSGSVKEMRFGSGIGGAC